MPSAWVFVSCMIAEARVSPSFLKTPLILRDSVSSFWGWLPPVLRPACLRFSRPTCLRSYWGPRTSGSYWGLSASSVFEARVASVVCSRPTCLRLSRSSCLRLGFSYLQPKELISSNSNTLMYSILTILFPTSSKTVEHCYYDRLRLWGSGVVVLASSKRK